MAEPINYGMAAMFQAMTAMQAPQVQAAGKAADAGEPSDFQKLMDQNTQPAQPAQSAQAESQPKDSAGTSGTVQDAEPEPKEAVSDVPEEPVVPVAEDPLDTVRRLLESGELAIASAAVSFQAPVIVAQQEDSGEELLPVQTVESVSQNVEAGLLDTPQASPVQEAANAVVFTDVEPQAAVQTAQTTQAAPTAQTVQTPQTVQVSEPVQTPDVTQEDSQTVVTVEAGEAEAPVEVKAEKTQYAAETESIPQDDSQEEPEAEASVGSAPLFHDVKAAPIKVGEAPAAEKSDAPDVGGQLADPLANALAQGESKVTVRLTPESLGSVEVEITQSADGILRVALSAANSETRSLLEKHAVNLQGLLASRGQENVQVQVQRQEESQQGENHSYDGHSGNQGYQQEQRRQHQPANSEDFLQQLRLGLIPLDAAVS